MCYYTKNNRIMMMMKFCGLHFCIKQKFNFQGIQFFIEYSINNYINFILNKPIFISSFFINY